jgi:hypothetical protein
MVVSVVLGLFTGTVSVGSSSEPTFDLLLANALLRSESKSNGGFLVLGTLGAVFSISGADKIGGFDAEAALLPTGFKRTLHKASAEIPRQSDFDASVEVLGSLVFCGTFPLSNPKGKGGAGGGGIELLLTFTTVVDDEVD